MFRAVPVETVDGHDDGELLPWLCTERKTYTDRDRGVHFLGAGLGVVMWDEIFSQWSIMKSSNNKLETASSDEVFFYLLRAIVEGNLLS